MNRPSETRFLQPASPWAPQAIESALHVEAFTCSLRSAPSARYDQSRIAVEGTMELDIGRIVAVLLVGGLAGSLIGRLMKGRKAGFGIWKNLLIGVGGAVLGTFLFSVLGIDLGLDNLKITFNDLVASLLGSLLLLLIVWFVRRGKKKPAEPA